MKFACVVAADKALGIGIDNRLPWRLAGDQKYFRQLTIKASPGRQNAVIMGRKTWESIPSSFRPLPGRINIVISRNKDYATTDGALLADSLDTALSLASSHQAEDCFVLGGEQIYKQAVCHKDCAKIFLTEINAQFACDTHFPDFQNDFEEVSASAAVAENGIEYCYKVFKSKSQDKAK